MEILNFMYCIIRYRINDYTNPHTAIVSVWDNFRHAKCMRRHLNKVYKKLKINYRFDVVVVPYKNFYSLAPVVISGQVATKLRAREVTAFVPVDLIWLEALSMDEME